MHGVIQIVVLDRKWNFIDSGITLPVAYLGFHFGGGGGFKIFLEKWGNLHGVC